MPGKRIQVGEGLITKVALELEVLGVSVLVLLKGVGRVERFVAVPADELVLHDHHLLVHPEGQGGQQQLGVDTNNTSSVIFNILIIIKSNSIKKDP